MGKEGGGEEGSLFSTLVATSTKATAVRSESRSWEAEGFGGDGGW